MAGSQTQSRPFTLRTDLSRRDRAAEMFLKARAIISLCKSQVDGEVEDNCRCAFASVSPMIIRAASMVCAANLLINAEAERAEDLRASFDLMLSLMRTHGDDQPMPDELMESWYQDVLDMLNVFVPQETSCRAASKDLQRHVGADAGDGVKASSHPTGQAKKAGKSAVREADPAYL